MVLIVKSMVFPMVMYGCDSWTVKKVECQRIDAFKLWCWIRLLKVPWKARRSNQLILREINPEYQSLEGLMLKLKLIWSDSGHLIRTDNSWEKSLMLRKIKAEGEEVSKDEMVDGITNAMNMNLGILWKMVRDKEAWCAAVHRVTKSQTWLSNWTTTTWSVGFTPHGKQECVPINLRERRYCFSLFGIASHDHSWHMSVFRHVIMPNHMIVLLNCEYLENHFIPRCNPAFL